MVTHHLEEVLPDTDVVVLMSNGKIVAQGPPQEVLTSEVLSDAFRVSVTVACEHEQHGDGRFAPRCGDRCCRRLPGWNASH